MAEEAEEMKKVAVMMVMVAMATVAQAEDQTYVFRELEPMPSGGYFYKISLQGQEAAMLGSDLDEKTVAAIIRFLQVDNAVDVIGRSIDLPGPDPDSIEWRVFGIQHPYYRPPTDQWIRTRAAEALARGEEPSYDGIWKGDVAKAFSDVFFLEADETWAWLFFREIEQIGIIAKSRVCANL